MSGARIRIPRQSASNFFIGLFCGACLTVGGIGASLAYERITEAKAVFMYRLSKWYNNPYTGSQIIQHDYVLANRIEVVEDNCFVLWLDASVVASECAPVRIVRIKDADARAENYEDLVNEPTRVRYRYEPELEYVVASD